MPSTKVVKYLLLLVYAFLLIVAKGQHELWRDEWHPFQMAYDISGRIEFYNALRYEGHPPLYYYLLRLLAAISGNNIQAFQLLHLVPALFAMYFVLLKFNLPLIWNMLLIFNAYFLFEYGVLSRSYVFVFFLVIYIVYLIHQQKNYAWVLVLCTMGIQLHVLFSPVFLFLAAYYVRMQTMRRHQILLSVLLLVGSLAFALWFVQPPADSIRPLMHPDFFSYTTWNTTLSKLYYAFVPIPKFRSNIDWNMLQPRPWWALTTLIVLLIFVLRHLVPRRHMLMFLFFSTMLLALQVVAQTWALRHFSALFMMCFAAILLFYSVAGQRTWLTGLFAIILSVQSAYALVNFTRDRQHEFSGAKQAALVLQKNVHLRHLPYVAAFHPALESFAGYAQKQVFILNNQKSYSFFKWTADLEKPLDGVELNTAIEAQLMLHDSVIFVQQLNQLIAFDRAALSANLLGSSSEAMVSDECFAIYLLRRK